MLSCTWKLLQSLRISTPCCFHLILSPKETKGRPKPSCRIGTQECCALSQIGYIATSKKIEQLIHHYFSGISLFYPLGVAILYKIYIIYTYMYIDNNIVCLNTVILYLWYSMVSTLENHCHSGARLEAFTSSTAADFLPPLKNPLKNMKVLSGIIIIHPIFRNRPCWRMHIKKAWCASKETTRAICRPFEPLPAGIVG